MRKLAVFCFLVASLYVSGLLRAQEPAEKVRTICDVADPKNKCPDVVKCACVDDTFEITFDGDTDSVFEYETFTAGAPVDTVVVTNTTKPNVQGWSYGVHHDDTYLNLVSVGIDGTDTKTLIMEGFNATTFENVEGGGYISAIVLSFVQDISLPVKRNTLAKASYTLKADPGDAGTLISISDQLNRKGSPKADINLTIKGDSRRPTQVTDGWVKKKGISAQEICNNSIDDDGDGKIDCADPDCAGNAACKEVCNNGRDDDVDGKIDCEDSDCTGDPACPVTGCKDYALYFGPAASETTFAAGAAPSMAISGRNKAASGGFQLGVKTTTAGGTTTFEFSGSLGTDNDRLIDLIIADDQANPQTPATPNKATASTGTISSVERGAAIAGFSGRDFFAADLAPGVGGPGFTVGYVADTNPSGAGQKIPVTGSGTPCPVNELLKVNLGVIPPTNFSRGDADGNSKINVIDAILIIQIKVGSIAAKFGCDDVLDADDNGQVTVTDAIPVLQYVFQKGPSLPTPFRVCAADGTNNDTLSCTQSNCQ